MKIDYAKIEQYIDATKVKYNEPMKKHTTLRVGGPADVLVIPTSVEDIVSVLDFVKENQVPLTIIGNGSKILVLDEGIEGIVMKLGNKFSEYKIEGSYITAMSGILVPRLSIIAKDEGMSGLEFASGIPASLGGAVYMNAGAYSGEMSDVIEEVTYIDKELNIQTIKKEELEFKYRSSYFKINESDNNIIISAKIKLSQGNEDEISEKMVEYHNSRKQKQPLEYPTAGSTFKRPQGHFVGKLIDDSGLKGYRIGDAQISTKHSGFIVNLGNATSKDMIQLINHIKEVVYDKYEVKLEEEIIILGGRN